MCASETVHQLDYLLPLAAGMLQITGSATEKSTMCHEQTLREHVRGEVRV